jgi:hypothetical protein
VRGAGQYVSERVSDLKYWIRCGSLRAQVPQWELGPTSTGFDVEAYRLWSFEITRFVKRYSVQGYQLVQLLSAATKSIASRVVKNILSTLGVADLFWERVRIRLAAVYDVEMVLWPEREFIDLHFPSFKKDEMRIPFINRLEILRQRYALEVGMIPTSEFVDLLLGVISRRDCFLTLEVGKGMTLDRLRYLCLHMDVKETRVCPEVDLVTPERGFGVSSNVRSKNVTNFGVRKISTTVSVLVVTAVTLPLLPTILLSPMA